jgi:hypothetical protein
MLRQACLAVSLSPRSSLPVTRKPSPYSGRGAAATASKSGKTVVDVYTFDDGLCIRVEGFETKARALEAMGLSEQDAHADN